MSTNVEISKLPLDSIHSLNEEKLTRLFKGIDPSESKSIQIGAVIVAYNRKVLQRSCRLYDAVAAKALPRLTKAKYLEASDNPITYAQIITLYKLTKEELDGEIAKVVKKPKEPVLTKTLLAKAVKDDEVYTYVLTTFNLTKEEFAKQAKLAVSLKAFTDWSNKYE